MIDLSTGTYGTQQRIYEMWSKIDRLDHRARIRFNRKPYDCKWNIYRKESEEDAEPRGMDSES